MRCPWDWLSVALAFSFLGATPIMATQSVGPGTISQMTIFDSYVRVSSADMTHAVPNCPSGAFILLRTTPNYDAYLAALIAAQHAGKPVALQVADACHNGDGAIIAVLYVNT